MELSEEDFNELSKEFISIETELPTEDGHYKVICQTGSMVKKKKISESRFSVKDNSFQNMDWTYVIMWKKD